LSFSCVTWWILLYVFMEVKGLIYIDGPANDKTLVSLSSITNPNVLTTVGVLGIYCIYTCKMMHALINSKRIIKQKLYGHTNVPCMEQLIPIALFQPLIWGKTKYACKCAPLLLSGNFQFLYLSPVSPQSKINNSMTTIDTYLNTLE